ncbi:hypothetical protein [Anaerocolumna chitinilytica]|uniref:Uncharacterized protein n=1 Tax=Anaerocolumna chitinilytica TaxID=1727145 RepID=A0A7M3SAJ7_9FIRM|nr:hypothetical protein [Anaerocolumna chitinilytica]BCK01615.1 hypothetical protein bsdcttw_46550 [Anaerocolumna chitinilytica]
MKQECILSTAQKALIENYNMIICSFQKEYLKRAEKNPRDAEIILRDMCRDKSILELQSKIAEVYYMSTGTRIIAENFEETKLLEEVLKHTTNQ